MRRICVPTTSQLICFDKTSGELTFVPGDATLRSGRATFKSGHMKQRSSVTAGYLIFVPAASFVLFFFQKISFNKLVQTFQATDSVEPFEEVNPEPMEGESAADAMAALSLSGAMNSGHSKKKKKKKRK